jgi:hypothetical protein
MAWPQELKYALDTCLGSPWFQFFTVISFKPLETVFAGRGINANARDHTTLPHTPQ